MHKYTKVLDKFPKHKTFLFAVYTSTRSPQFLKEFETLTFRDKVYYNITYSIYSPSSRMISLSALSSADANLKALPFCFTAASTSSVTFLSSSDAY